jgi:hypothetical protein
LPGVEIPGPVVPGKKHSDDVGIGKSLDWIEPAAGCIEGGHVVPIARADDVIRTGMCEMRGERK